MTEQNAFDALFEKQNQDVHRIIPTSHVDQDRNTLVIELDLAEIAKSRKRNDRGPRGFIFEPVDFETGGKRIRLCQIGRAHV